jgi:histidyl-tRNA synthetase
MYIAKSSTVLKFELPRGMRDLEPKEYQLIELTRQKFFETSELFGFGIMEPSPIESLSTLEAKSGPAIAKEIYGFRDKAGRDIALRFDLTIGLTRYASSRRDLRLPVKLAAFGSMFRYDEPQMGRYRWFHQWDVEIYDSFNIESDAEVMEFTATYLDSLGIDCFIDVCDRELLEDFIRSKLHVGEKDLVLEMLRAVDKVPKKGQEAVLNEYSERGFDLHKLQELFGLSTLKGDPDKVLSDDRVKNLEKVGKLSDVMNSLKARGITSARINMGIVRGLDYYSGIVFEAFDKSGEVGALVGGGRYDTLTAVFGRSDIGATGAAGGIERIVHVLMKKGSLELKKIGRSVYVAYAREDLKQTARNIVSVLRKNSIISELDTSSRPLRKQLEEASKRGYMYTLILAPEELAGNELIIRNMESGAEARAKLDEFTKNPGKFIH